jgi:16S rRNA (adenine1518-N6/adenine1519-N6)-dimethyltransferase
LLQAFYHIEYLFTVHENVFDPPPKVKSAVIRLRRNKVEKLNCNEPLFVRVVKAGFNQRRKMLRNSLQVILGKDNPAFQLPIFTKRPEQLSVGEFVELTNIVEKYQTTT